MKTKLFFLISPIVFAILTFTPNTFAQEDEPYIEISGRTGGVFSVAFSPDGNTLASGSDDDDTIRLWNAKTGAFLKTLTGHTYPVSSVAFSPDGNTLAGGSLDGTIHLWNAKTGAHLKTLTGHTYPVSSVAFSPECDTLASCSYDTIRLWNTNTGTLLKTLEGHALDGDGYPVFSVAFSPDGNTLASGGGIIRLWNAKTGALLNTLTEQTIFVFSVAFSPDSNTLVSGGAGLDTIHLWNVKTETLLKTLTGHTDIVKSVAFSPDGNTLASASEDDTICLWNSETGAHLKTLEGHTHDVSSVAFSPDGNTLASGSLDETIRLWQVQGGTTPEPDDHGNTREEATLFTLGGALTGEIDPSTDVDYFKLEIEEAGELTLYTEGELDTVGKFLNANGDHLITSTNDGDGTNFLIRYPVISGTYYVKVTELNKDATGDYRLYAIFTSFEGIGDYPDLEGKFSESVRVVAYSPSGDVLVTGDNANKIHVFDPFTGKKIRVFKSKEAWGEGIPWGNIRSIAFSPDGKWCAAGTDGKFEVLVWYKLKRTWADPDAWGVPFRYDKITQTFPKETDHTINTVRSVAFSPDSRYLAVGTDGDQVFIQKYANGLGWSTNIRVLDTDNNYDGGHDGNVTSVAWLPYIGEHVVATGCDDEVIRLWDLQKPYDETLIHPLPPYGEEVHCLSFSPDGTRLAAGYNDGNIRLFGFDNGITRWITYSIAKKQHDGAVLSLAFHPSGNVLVSVGSDGDISFLDMNTLSSLTKVKLKDGDKISSIAFNSFGNALAIGTEGKLGLGGFPARVFQFEYSGTTDFTNKGNFNLEIPANFISEVAYSENATYFVLNLQLPSVTSDPPGQTFFRADCIITLDLPDVEQTPVSNADAYAGGSDGQRLDNPQYFMYSLQTPRQRIAAIETYTGDTGFKVLTSVIGGGIGAGIGFAIGSVIPGAGNLFGAGVGAFAGQLTARVIGSVSGKLIGVGLRKAGVGSQFFETGEEKAEKEKASILAETADPFFLIQPTNLETETDDQYRVLFLVEKPITEIGITVEQAYRLEREGPLYVAKYTRIYNLQEGAWSAPNARPITLADYPPFQLLPPEEQEYLLRHFGVTVNMNAEQLQIPEETSLLPNYPNPFNPETWIPYQLSEPADVKLTIYDINGSVVRALDLGHQPAGIYQSRVRAAHWDGKNAQGEAVASGIYFYTLKAGDFSATRKMLIQK